MASHNYNGFTTLTESQRAGILWRTERFPLDITSVFTSKANLDEYLKDAGGNCYPGQIVAVADDLTASGSKTTTRTEQGLYLINNTTSGGTTFTASKIALLSDISGGGSSADLTDLITKQVNPTVTLLNEMYGEDTSGDNVPWEVVEPESTTATYNGYEITYNDANVVI